MGWLSQILGVILEGNHTGIFCWPFPKDGPGTHWEYFEVTQNKLQDTDIWVCPRIDFGEPHPKFNKTPPGPKVPQTQDSQYTLKTVACGWVGGAKSLIGMLLIYS